MALSSASVWVRDIPQGPASPSPPATRVIPDGVPLRSIPIVSSLEDLRRCSKCRLRKPLSAYNRSGEDRQWYCRDCFRSYFEARGDLHREQVERSVAKRRIAARSLLKLRLQAGCADCGADDPLVLEFDHLGDEKTGDVSQMAWAGKGAERILAELEKCEVVCVNCHKRRTYSRMPSCWRLAPTEILAHPRLADGAKRNRIYIWDLLVNSECVDCGLADPVVLEFDHRRDKTASVPVMARDGCSLQLLLEEVAKCEIRCANCHRRRTIRALRADRAAAA